MSVRILMISGALRARSTNTAVLRTAAELDLPGVEAVLYEGMAGLPHFNPDDDPPSADPPAPVVALRAELARADALLFSTPEYAGALPGAFKNLLDWTVGGGETYGLGVAWINAAGAAAPTGGADAHQSLRKVLAYTGCVIVEPACRRIPVPRDLLGDDGLIHDREIRERIGDAVDTLAREARPRTL